MREFPGIPGTFTGLALRIAQCIFAAASIGLMVTTNEFFNFTSFCYLIASMALQLVWSFGLVLLDAYALSANKVVHSPALVGLFVIGDSITAMLSLAASSSSAGIIVLYFNDLGDCNFGEECQRYQLSAAFGIMSWFTTAMSSLLMLWLLAGG